MKKAKTKKAVAKKTTGKTRHVHNHTGNGVYWYGIHVHHIGLGVAAIGTLVLVILVGQMGV